MREQKKRISKKLFFIRHLLQDKTFRKQHCDYTFSDFPDLHAIIHSPPDTVAVSRHTGVY